MKMQRLRPAGRLFYWLVMIVLAAVGLRAADTPPVATLIQDTVYRADGTPAAGSLVISWPAFETLDHKTVVAGVLSVKLGPGGSLSVPLSPNQGATPAGTFYKVVVKLDDGTTTTEYWNVPNISPATVASVRTTILPGPVTHPTENFVQEAEVSVTPLANKIPRADSNGIVDAGWIPARGTAGLVLHVDTTSAGTPADTGEHDLFTWTLPANSLNANGKTVRATFFGTGNGATTTTLKVYFGATSFGATDGVPTGPGGAAVGAWRITVTVIRTGAAGEIGWAEYWDDTSNIRLRTEIALSADTTAGITIRLTGQNVSGTIANAVVYRASTVELLN